MSYLFNGKSMFIVASGEAFTLGNAALPPMGFITNGGEFRDGPPPPPSAPPPSRYETFAQLDSQAGNPSSNIFSAPAETPPTSTTNHTSGGGNEPNGQKDNYPCDVFAIIQNTVNVKTGGEVLPNLVQTFHLSDGVIAIHEIGKAEALNQQHKEEHLKANPNTIWQEPHMEARLVVDYIPNKDPATFERAYGQFIDGDPAHEQVFVTTAGSLSIDQLQKAVDQYQLLQEPQRIATVTIDKPSEKPSIVTRSLVSRSTTGQVQYMVYRDDASFEPK